MSTDSGPGGRAAKRTMMIGITLAAVMVVAAACGGGGSSKSSTTTTNGSNKPKAAAPAACASGQVRVKGQCTTATTVPPSLTSVIPTYITSNKNDSCTSVGSSDFTDVNATAEAVCDLTGNTNAPEDFVVYAQFSGQSNEQGYYGTLLSNNGMKTGAGDCSTLSEDSTSSGGNKFCETTYSGNHKGDIFIYEGAASFQLGNNTTVDQGCSAASGSSGNSGASSGNSGTGTVAVLGFSDDSDNVVGVAVSCVDNAHGMLNDFHNANLDVGS